MQGTLAIYEGRKNSKVCSKRKRCLSLTGISRKEGLKLPPLLLFHLYADLPPQPAMQAIDPVAGDLIIAR